MKTILCALVLFSQAAGYEIYRSDMMGVEIGYPAGWNVIRIGYETLHITPATYEEWRGGAGRAPSPMPWVEVTGKTGRKCPEYTPEEISGYVAAKDYADRRLGFREWKICKKGVQFAFSIWDEDRQRSAHQKIFEEMSKKIAAVVP